MTMAVIMAYVPKPESIRDESLESTRQIFVLDTHFNPSFPVFFGMIGHRPIQRSEIPQIL